MEELIKFAELHPICQWEVIRVQRAPLLLEADHLVATALDCGLDTQPFRAYRQALRDITKIDSAESVQWPTKPQLSQS
ncbi:MAG: hypothetical protein ACI86X_000668 [Moritella sp.]|jgi:hypothetical protein